MRAVAEKLGARAEFSAIVFPSLLDAVQLGQVVVELALQLVDAGLQKAQLVVVGGVARQPQGLVHAVGRELVQMVGNVPYMGGDRTAEHQHDQSGQQQ